MGPHQLLQRRRHRPLPRRDGRRRRALRQGLRLRRVLGRAHKGGKAERKCLLFVAAVPVVFTFEHNTSTALHSSAPTRKEGHNYRFDSTRTVENVGLTRFWRYIPTIHVWRIKCPPGRANKDKYKKVE